MTITDDFKIENFKHRTDVQLRFSDVDVLGHVNNTIYFSFYDTGKALYFTDVRGSEMNWQQVDTVIANVDCAYIDSIHFGDKISVCTRCKEIRDKSFVMQQMLIDQTGKIKSVCETVMVSFEKTTKKTCRVPDSLREGLCQYEQKNLTIEKTK